MLGSRLLGALLQAASLVMVARIAGPSEFGVLAAFLGMVVVFQAAFDLGIPTYVTKLAATSRNAPQVVWCLRIFGYFGVLLFLGLSGAAVVISVVSGSSWWLLCPLAVSGWLERQSDVRLNIAVADGDVWKSSVNLVSRRILAITLLAGGLSVGMNATSAFSLASMLASIVSVWMSRSLVYLQAPEEKIEKSIVYEILQASRPFWANSIGAQLRNFDVVIVAAVVSPLIAGYYGVIARSLNPLMMLSSSLATIILPMATKNSGKSSRLLWVPIGIVLGVVFVAYGAMFVFMPHIIDLVFGPDFTATVTGFRVALVGLVFASLSSVQTAFLQARGKERAVGRVSVGTSIFMLAAIGGGAVSSGVTGAALGLAASYVLQCALLSVTNVRASLELKRLRAKNASPSVTV